MVVEVWPAHLRYVEAIVKPLGEAVHILPAVAGPSANAISTTNFIIDLMKEIYLKNIYI